MENLNDEILEHENYTKKLLSESEERINNLIAVNEQINALYKDALKSLIDRERIITDLQSKLYANLTA